MLIDKKALKVAADAVREKSLNFCASQDVARAAIEAYEAAKASEQPVDKSDLRHAMRFLRAMRPTVRDEAFMDFLLSRGAWGKGGNSAFMHVSPDEIIRAAFLCANERESSWQPIETASLDGRRLRLQCADGEYDGWYESEEFG